MGHTGGECKGLNAWFALHHYEDNESRSFGWSLPLGSSVVNAEVFEILVLEFSGIEYLRVCLCARRLRGV